MLLEPATEATGGCVGIDFSLRVEASIFRSLTLRQGRGSMFSLLKFSRDEIERRALVRLSFSTFLLNVRIPRTESINTTGSDI